MFIVKICKHLPHSLLSSQSSLGKQAQKHYNRKELHKLSGLEAEVTRSPVGQRPGSGELAAIRFTWQRQSLEWHWIWERSRWNFRVSWEREDHGFVWKPHFSWFCPKGQRNQEYKKLGSKTFFFFLKKSRKALPRVWRGVVFPLARRPPFLPRSPSHPIPLLLKQSGIFWSWGTVSLQCTSGSEIEILISYRAIILFSYLMGMFSISQYLTTSPYRDRFVFMLVKCPLPQSLL